ncbi:dTDP-glucose 4,6-dehydratase [Dissulfuribacter thermophilus]|uniref:UDP-glucuronate decarboxylase n=1 Tax=Dissulfuribacter thermophilus TaxID=1156395 RepID=A0A1B9F8L3_9BACT|nr:GDP-mannose 4,6-dehydratase [Dissulfuribacter thermophilus]OCC16279.1 dTDP-glucose 4,6-dehydratase [Dissulfuribacter thermophilus]
MNILVTGGAGFIGSNLTDHLVSRGDNVTVIDNLSTGSLDNIAHLQRLSNFKYVNDTILNEEVMDELTKEADCVIHLAAAVGVKYVLENPLTSIETNIKGTEIVLNCANRHKKRVLIASTSEVYGKHMHAPLKEDDNLIYGPPSTMRWSYAAAKLVDEFTALAYHRTKKLEVIIFRCFNTIGPRQTGLYGMVVPRFIKQALRDEPITVYGDGTQTRTFTYVGDVVESLTRLMECDAAIGEIINIGGKEEVSIKELAERIKKLANSNSEIILVPYNQAYGKDFEDMMRRVPSLEKLEALIGYSPNTPLDEILKKTIEYFRTKAD